MPVHPCTDGCRLAEIEVEVARLREGLLLIESEPINAEYMARNILNGLPANHGTMIDECKNDGGKCGVGGYCDDCQK